MSRLCGGYSELQLQFVAHDNIDPYISVYIAAYTVQVDPLDIRLTVPIVCVQLSQCVPPIRIYLSRA